MQVHYSNQLAIGHHGQRHDTELFHEEDRARGQLIRFDCLGLPVHHLANRHIQKILRSFHQPGQIPGRHDPEHAIVCDRSSRCTVNVLWVRVRDAITATLDSMTLADLVPQRMVGVDDPKGVLITS